MPLIYNTLNNSIQEQINNDIRSKSDNKYKFSDDFAVRRDNSRDVANLWRTAFVRDIEKILHLPIYNRYSDKTQVFSLYLNDDITRRALHVQLVSRISRNIGKVLGLNLDLIEAIAVGHDIGHTPFGHAGESFLSELLHYETNRYFFHNVHSVRVLDKIYRRNLTLQTLDGILSHNGELEEIKYVPKSNRDFVEFDKLINECYLKGKSAINSLTPSTLEGCLVKICDIIAYLGKDRQDARIARILDERVPFSDVNIGIENAAIINNLTVDIIENSYGKNYISLSKKAYQSLKTAKEENYIYIYKNSTLNNLYNDCIKPMFEEVYYKLLSDLKNREYNSYIYSHHIKHITDYTKYYANYDYINEDPNDIVVDYIASMTDDYFIELHKILFPNSNYKVKYRSYFE